MVTAIGLSGGSIVVFWNAYGRYHQIARAPRIEVSDIETLSVGERIFVEGVIRSSDPDFSERMQDGCIVDLTTPEGTAEATNEEVRYEVQLQEGSVELAWFGECPEGNLVLADPPENPTRAWLGYAEDTRITFEGERTEEEELSLEAVQYRVDDEVEHLLGDTPRTREWLEELQREPRVLMILSGLVLLACGMLFIGLARAPGTRKQWDLLAQKEGWEHQRGKLSPGHLRGQIEDCELDIHRMEYLGADGVTPGHIEVHLALPEHLPARAVEPLLETTGPDPESPIGIQMRRTGLLKQLDSLQKKKHRLELRKEDLVLVMKGLGTRQIREGVDLLAKIHASIRETALSDIRQLAEAHGWRLELGAEWKAWDSDGEQVLFTRTQPPPSFELSLPLPAGAPEGLRIQDKSSSPPGLRLSDPILDEMVSMEATDPAQIEALLKRPGLTEAVLDLVKGHGGEVIDGRILVKRDAFLLQPTEEWESIEVLAGVLGKGTSAGPETS